MTNGAHLYLQFNIDELRLQQCIFFDMLKFYASNVRNYLDTKDCWRVVQKQAI